MGGPAAGPSGGWKEANGSRASEMLSRAAAGYRRRAARNQRPQSNYWPPPPPEPLAQRRVAS